MNAQASWAIDWWKDCGHLGTEVEFTFGSIKVGQAKASAIRLTNAVVLATAVVACLSVGGQLASGAGEARWTTTYNGELVAAYFCDACASIEASVVCVS